MEWIRSPIGRLECLGWHVGTNVVWQLLSGSSAVLLLFLLPLIGLDCVIINKRLNDLEPSKRFRWAVWIGYIYASLMLGASTPGAGPKWLVVPMVSAFIASGALFVILVGRPGKKAKEAAARKAASSMNATRLKALQKAT